MSVLLNEDVSKKIFYVLEKLQDIIDNTKDSTINFEKNKVIFKTDIQTCINYKFEDGLETSIQKMLIDHAYKAEKLSPGGFSKTITFSNFILKKQDFSFDVESVFHPTIDDLKELVHLFCKDENISSLCFEAIKLAGFGGKISIEKSLNGSKSIELIDGYVFKHDPLGLHPIKVKKPRVICIDGYIESVAEVNLLFEGAAQLKHPLVLISRGMHDDVLNTIKVNRDRGSMFIYPVKIAFDLNGINTISDLSTIIGIPPISCNLGNLISSTKIDDSIEVDEVLISGNSLTVKNSKTRHAVNLHMKTLIEKRETAENSVEELLTSRIKSLSGSCVVIRLPDDSKFITTSQTIDHTLRSIKSMLDFGIFFKDDEINLYGSYKFSKELAEKFCFLINNVYAYVD